MLRLCCVSDRGLLCGSLSNDKMKLDVRVGGYIFIGLYLMDSTQLIFHVEWELHMDGCWLAVN